MVSSIAITLPGYTNHSTSETMKRVLQFPPDTKLEWKSHDSSIQQRTAIEESRREKAGNHHSEKRSSKPHQTQADDLKSSLNA